MTDQVGELISSRLRMRPLRPSDIDDLVALHSDPRVMEGRAGVATPEARRETESWLARALAVPHSGGLGLFRVEDRLTGEFIGRAGNRPEAGTEQIEIAYALRSDRWGIGLGTEMARLLWEHAARLDVTVLVGDVLVGNIASQRILQGLGMSVVKEYAYPADGMMVRRFEGRPRLA
ncbi:MAG: GNAT family N-acetyltransferase [Candidatus Dormibacteria bacterium]